MPIRVLVGMTGRYAQQQIKERNRRVLLKHWWRFGLMAMAVVVVAFSIWLIAPGLEVPLWAVVPATFLCVTGAAWDQLAGTYNLANGRDAEKWTSKELRKVCGPGWHVVDGISFAFHDVDHVLVGPGGVYAIETKYTDSMIELSSRRGYEWVRPHLEQAIEGARSIRYLLWNHKVSVEPIVFVWGGEVTGSPASFDGVPVLRRKGLDHPDLPWLKSGTVLSQDKVDEIVQWLLEYRDKRIRYDRRQGRRDAA